MSFRSKRCRAAARSWSKLRKISRHDRAIASHVTLRYILLRTFYIRVVVIARISDASGCSFRGPQVFPLEESCRAYVDKRAPAWRKYITEVIRARASGRFPFSAVEASAGTYASRGTRSQRDTPPPRGGESPAREGYSHREGSRKRTSSATRFDREANALSLPRETISLRARDCLRSSARRRGRETYEGTFLEKLPWDDGTPGANPAECPRRINEPPLPPHRARN